MKFVHPEFLWASLLIAIPVIVHLFNFRRYKTIYFSRVKFLKEVTEDSKSGLKLKHLLVLASRILAILFLVLAFSQPFIPSGDQANVGNTSLIYIDNSYSMQASGIDGNLLNESKNQAIELVKSFEKNEKIALLTSDLSSDQFRFYSPDDVIETIKKIDFSPRTTRLSTVLNSQIDLVTNQTQKTNNRIFIFSDFQKTVSDLDDFKRAEIPCYYYVAKSQQTENIYIDSVWFETPVHRLSAPVDVFFRVVNQSNVAQEDLTVSLKIDDSQPAPKRISVDANSSTVSSINFTDRTAGIKSGIISVSTSQLYFDDSYFFTYEIKEQVEILLVKNSNTTGKNIEQLYNLDSYYHSETTTIDAVTQDQFKNKELIIFQNVNQIPGGLSDLISNGLKDGATVVLIPGSETDVSNWNTILGSQNFPTLGSFNVSGELNYFNSADPLYKGVFESVPSNYKLPQVTKGYSLNVQGNQNFMTLFGFNSTRPFMVYGPRSNGRLILLAAPIDLLFTDFQNHALFAATFLRIAETSSFQKPLSMTIGHMDNLAFNKPIDEKNPIHLINTEFQTDVIPQMINTGNSRSLSFAPLQEKIKEAGFYKLTDQLQFNDILALNYDRYESDISCLTKEEVKNLFTEAGWQNTAELIVSASGQLEINQLKSREYWRICLILSILFIAVEILLLKLWKT